MFAIFNYTEPRIHIFTIAGMDVDEDGQFVGIHKTINPQSGEEGPEIIPVKFIPGLNSVEIGVVKILKGTFKGKLLCDEFVNKIDRREIIEIGEVDDVQDVRSSTFKPQEAINLIRGALDLSLLDSLIQGDDRKVVRDEYTNQRQKIVDKLEQMKAAGGRV